MPYRLIGFILFILISISCNSPKEVKNIAYNYLNQSFPANRPSIFAPGVISQPARFELGFTISPDGKHMAFGVAHESDPKQTCIYFLHQQNGIWSEPTKEGMEDNKNTFFPMFSPDNKYFYFSKSADGAENDIWQGQYVDNMVKGAKPLNSKINSQSREAGHGQTLAGDFYFTSNRDDKHVCCGDIYYSQNEQGEYRSVERVEALSSDADEESLYLSPNESYIIIQAWKKEYESMHDLYICYRDKSGQWGAPLRLDSAINSPEREQRPFISPDKKYLFFSRMSVNQVDEKTLYESDIYWVSTKTIFKPYVFNPNIDANLATDKEFSITLPEDLFKHVTDSTLIYEARLDNADPLPSWIDFDPEKLELSGNWGEKDELLVEIVAFDKAGNQGIFKFKLARKR